MRIDEAWQKGLAAEIDFLGCAAFVHRFNFATGAEHEDLSIFDGDGFYGGLRFVTVTMSPP